MRPLAINVRLAELIRLGAEDVYRASTLAADVQRFGLSSQLLDRALELFDTARELVELPAQSAEGEHRQDLPF